MLLLILLKFTSTKQHTCAEFKIAIFDLFVFTIDVNCHSRTLAAGV